jgi:hypothetical protein
MLALHNLTIPIANLQRNFHHHHASSIVTCKIPMCYGEWQKGTKGGGSKLNTKQRSLGGKCTRREVE